MANLLIASVGSGGKNLLSDVMTVQRLLNDHCYDPGVIDGLCGNRTIGAIIQFQSRFMKIADGRVDLGGKTWQRLTKPISADLVSQSPAATQKINAAGLQIIKEAEGLRLKVYLCPARGWTIGYGHTRGVIPRMTITQKQAEAYLRRDLVATEKTVAKSVKVALTVNQFSALVCFTFNLGKSNLQCSTLLKKLNEGDYRGAADEFLRRVYAHGQDLAGIATRRDKERTLFLQ